MTLLQLWELCREHPAAAVLLALLGGTVTVKRLELPVYKWARDWLNARLDGLGRRLNAGLAGQVETLAAEVATLRDEVGDIRAEQKRHEAVADQRRADDLRDRILHFNVEILGGVWHDRESYVEILDVITKYERFCTDHDDYPNRRATSAIDNIQRNYTHRLTVGFDREE